MKLTQVKGNTWCLEGTALIPVYRLDEHRCVLLDSGWASERKDLEETLEREGLIPVGVISSHTHEDHVGNHGWLKQKYGTQICTSAGEAALGRSLAMYKMVCPPMPWDMLENISFHTDRIVAPVDGVEEFCGVPFRIHHTPGHAPEHICIGTPDGVCYLGDLLMSEQFCLRAQIPFHYVHWMTRASMEKIKQVEGYTCFVAAHKGVTDDSSGWVDTTLKRLDWICEQILGLLEEPVTWDTLVRNIIERNQLYTSDPIKAIGYETSTQPFVDYLQETGRLDIRTERGCRYFRRT